MQKEKPDLKKSLNRKNKRFIIRLMGWLTGPVTPVSEFTGPVNRIIILAQEKSGDCILLTPLIRQIRHQFPDVILHLACFSALSYEFFKNDSRINAVFRVKTDLWGFFRHGRSFGYDILFNTKDHPSFNFMLQSMLIKARIKIGIDHPNHDNYFNYEITGEFYRPVIDKYRDFASFIGMNLQTGHWRPDLPPTLIRKEILAFANSLPDGCLAINLSAGEPDREWTEASWEEVIRALDKPVVILAVGKQIQVKKSLTERLSLVLPTPETQSLQEAEAILRHCRLLISPDTSLIHIASGIGLPVVGLYRAGDLHLKRFAPWGIPHQTIQSPDYRVSAIQPEPVIRASKDLWKQTRTAS